MADFRDVRVLGLDVGSKTIGVAVTDELGVCAHAVTTLTRRGTVRDVEQVLALARELGAERAVVGMPYEPDGTEGHRAARVRVFLDALAAAGLARRAVGRALLDGRGRGGAARGRPVAQEA